MYLLGRKIPRAARKEFPRGLRVRVGRSHLSKLIKISIRNYGGKEATRIDAIQLELATELLAKTQLDRTAGDFAEAIDVFAREYLLKQFAIARRDA